MCLAMVRHCGLSYDYMKQLFVAIVFLFILKQL
jgi:hypothetical protein